MCHMACVALPNTALRWTAGGRRRRGRPEKTRRRNVKRRRTHATCHGTPSPGGLQTDSSGAVLYKPYVPHRTGGLKRTESE